MRKNIIILSLFFFLLGLQGCGKEKYDEMAYYTTYQREEIDLSNIDEKETIWDIECEGDKAVVATFVSNQNLTEGKRRIHLYEMDLKTKDIQEIAFEIESATEMVRDITIDKQGLIYMLSQEPDGAEGFLNKIDTKQGLLERKTISEEVLSYFETGYIQLLADADGFTYFVGVMELVILDKQGEVYYTMANDHMFGDAVQMENGKVFFSINGSEYEGNYQFDAENKKWEEYSLLDVYPDEGDGLNGELISGDEGYDFYYDDVGNLYSDNIVWGIKDKRAYKLFKYEDANVLGENITAKCAIGECSFLCVETVQMGERFNQLVILRPASAEKAEKSNDKTTLQMVGYGISDGIKSAVYYFNQSNERYYIDIKDYAIGNSEEEDAIKKLNLELLQPGACDLLVLNCLPIEEYVDKEMLADLSPFLEQSSVIGKEDFLDGIIKVLTNERGAMYFMIPEFSIQTIVQKGQPEQEQKEQYFEMLEERSKQLEVGQRLFYDSEKGRILEILIRYNPDFLVNEKEKNCSFDGEAFRRILHFVDSVGTKETDYGISIAESIRTGQVMMLDWDLKDFLEIMLLDNLFGQNAEFIGYATASGSKQIIDSYGMEIGILNASEKKQGAWEFMEYIFEKDTYDTLFGKNQYPVRKDSIEEVIRFLSATEEYVEEDGTVVEPEEIEVGFEDYVIKPGTLTDRQVQIFESLCNNAIYKQNIDEKYMEIILEETESYFNGQKSENEVVNNLQNRIGNALKE